MPADTTAKVDDCTAGHYWAELVQTGGTDPTALVCVRCSRRLTVTPSPFPYEDDPVGAADNGVDEALDRAAVFLSYAAWVVIIATGATLGATAAWLILRRHDRG